MRFKKLTSLALSGAMALSTAMYMPSNANEATDAYFNDLKAVNTWEKIQSDTDINVGASLYEKKKTSTYGYTINTKSNYEKKALRGDIAISFVPASKDTPPIPAIHIYYNEKELYINKDFFNTVGVYLGVDKQIKSDYVKLKFDQKDLKKMGITPEMLKQTSNSQETFDKLVKFLKKIDLGIDIGFTKKDNTYSISWDSDKVVDILNAYIKYVLGNYEIFLDFYKEVFGIDMMDIYKEQGITISKEDIQKQMKEALQEWLKVEKEYLPKIKEVLKGTVITTTEVLTKDDYSQKARFKLVVDLAKAEKLFDENTNAIPGDLQKVSFNISIQGMSKNVPDLKIDMPTNSEEFNISEYIKQKQEELRETITITPSKKTITIEKKGQKINLKAQMKIEKGVLLVSRESIEEILGFKLGTNEKFVKAKQTLQDYGYKVTWDKKTKSTIATNM